MRKRVLLAAALPLAAIVLFGASLLPARSQNPLSAENTPPSETKNGVRIWRDIAYVTNGHARQKLDFYAPTESGGAGPWPLVVYIHGGGWEGGSKSGNMGAGLCGIGYAVASIDYRFSRDAPFPAQIEDCKAAVRYLRAHAARFHIDPKRIGVLGDSAGGHLSALVGTTGNTRIFDTGENLDQSSAVQAVVDLYGPTDLSFYSASAPDDTLSRLIGGPIQDNAEKVRAANPITYIDAADPPFAIFHGDSDKLVPQRHSEALRDALTKAGVPVTLTIIKGGGHGFTGEGGKEVATAAVAFLNKYVKK